MTLINPIISKVLSPAHILIGFAWVTLACTEPPSTGDSNGDAETSSSGDGDGDGDPEQLGPTWHQDIAPIVAQRCVGCHQTGSIGPFSLDNYADASVWAALALDAMQSKQMPPWGQDNTDDCQPRHPFLNDPRPTADELSLFAAWLDAGTPEGDPATAAPLPEPPQLSLQNSDVTLPIPTAVEVGPGPDQFWCLVIDPGFEQDTYINGSQIVPGNDAIVHHALVYVDAEGQSDALADANGRYECFGGPEVDGALIAVWAPGVPPQETPEDVAFKIPAGAKLVIQMHYHPTGAIEVDPNTSIQLRFAPELPAYVAEYALPGNEGSQDNTGYGLQPGPADPGGVAEFRVPAGVSDHTERMLIYVPPILNGSVIDEVLIWQVGSHMHYVGVDLRLGVERIEPEEGTGIDGECFLQTPYYDFEWQRTYRYDAPLEDMPTVRPGDAITIDCLYNNSMSNPHLVDALAEQGLDAPIDVFLGEETLDEMCLGVVGFATPL
jgi:hypothetical protein